MWTASGSRRRKPSPSTSTIVADNAGGYHDFVIEGFSRIKLLPTGDCLESGRFTAGGHRWRMDFYPNGDEEEYKGYVSLFLFLDEDITGRLKAQYDFAFMVQKRGPFFRKRLEKVITKPAQVRRFSGHRGFGFSKFVRNTSFDFDELVSKSDSLTIRCGVVVLDELRAEDPTAKAATPTTFVPPSDLHRHFGDLLLTGKGADVVFHVNGDKFPAHRCVLAARSPVFSAEFFGAMQGSTNTAAGGVIHVEDMMAPVFQALLCFLYTDSLPETGDEDEVAMYQHLLVAADRYSVQRLKLICEDKLCKNIDVPEVATTLTLAEQHHCHVLKKLCLDFLSTPANLEAVMATDGFKHLSRSCPSIKKDLDATLAS